MSHQVYFAVQSTASTSAYSLILFDKVLVNAGNGWSSASSSFTAPIAGYYFISFASACVTPGNNNTDAVLKVNGAQKAVLAIYDKEAGAHNGITMTRSAVMLQLAIGNIVTFTTHGYRSYSTTDGLVNAQGFLYNPTDGAAVAVAWGVAQSLNPPVMTSCSTGYRGPVNVVPYDTVYVNTLNVWSSDTNKVTIPVAGTYFIDLSALLCGKNFGGDGNSGLYKVA